MRGAIENADNSSRGPEPLGSGADPNDASAGAEYYAYRGEASCKIASALARIGATAGDISEALGISVATFNAWRRTYREFSEALKAQPEVSDAAVERAMIRCALGFNYTTEKLVPTRMGAVVRAHSVHVPPSIDAAHFMLRAKMPAAYGKRRERPPTHAFLSWLTAQNSKSETRDIRCPEEICRVLRTMARLGAADFEIAASLGIRLAAFNEMRSTHPGFSEAVRAGEELLNQALERALLKRVQGYSYLAEKFVCARHGSIVLQRKLKRVPPHAKAFDIWLRAHPLD